MVFTIVEISIDRSPSRLIFFAPACTFWRIRSMPSMTCWTAFAPFSAAWRARVAASAAEVALLETDSMFAAISWTAVVVFTISPVCFTEPCDNCSEDAWISVAEDATRFAAVWTSFNRSETFSSIRLIASLTLPRAPSVT